MRAAALGFLVTLAAAAPAAAQVGGHTILFGDSTAVAEADQIAIYDQLGYTVGADGTSLEAMDCGTIGAWVEETDLNGDGVAEVFVTGGNSCTSGMTGADIVLFVKDAEGVYRPHLGFPGLLSRKLETGNLGYPDLAVGGPGFCEGVYRWNGTTYQHHRNEATEPGGCDGFGS